MEHCYPKSKTIVFLEICNVDCMQLFLVILIKYNKKNICACNILIYFHEELYKNIYAYNI